jgi:hypothetical protein
MLLMGPVLWFLLFIATTGQAAIKIESAATFKLMILGGIFQPIRPELSVILIKNDKTNKVEAYKTGASITLDAKEYTISYIGEDFFLAEAKDSKTDVLKVLKAMFSGTGSGKTNPLPPGEKIDVSGSYKEDGFERKDGSINMSSSYRDQVIKGNLGQIMMQASSEPAIGPDGNIEGFRMDQIEDGSIFQKAGLQDGDVVSSINGQALNNPAAAVRLLQGLKDATEIQIEIKRGGSVVPVSVKVD